MYDWLRFHLAFCGYMLNRNDGKLHLTWMEKSPKMKTFDDVVSMVNFVKERNNERKGYSR